MQRSFVYAISALMAGVSGTAAAAGFALLEQNASGLGNAYAGQAASAQDASTVYFNPAGLMRIEGRQAVVAGHLIRPSAKFTDASGAASGGDAGGWAFVPSFYYAGDLAPGFRFGLGVNAPYGLKSEYDLPWAGQAQAVTSHLRTINVNPSIAWLYNQNVAVGAGINYLMADAILSSANGAGVVTKMKGDGDAWGYNLGVLVKLDNDNRVGLAYRSAMTPELEGMAAGVTPIAGDLDLPASASLSLFSRLSDTWDLLADLTWTGWSAFDKLQVLRRADGVAIYSVPGHWQDSLRVSVGANYHTGGKWTWRTGLAYDPTPVPDAQHRTPRIPDEDRVWLAFGGQYRLSPAGWVDFGLAHLFIKDADIDHTQNGVTLQGRYRSRMDIVSVQYTQAF